MNRRTASKAVLYYFKKARIFHGENKYPLPQRRKAAAGISALRSMRLWDDPYPGVNYPVTQTDDNEYYLHHLYDGTYNKTGCLFADYENQEDFSDRNTIIYGHNMRDGSMFATLNEYDEQSYYDGHPQMYLVTPDGGYVVEIFTAFVAKPSESGSDTSPWRLSFKDDGAYTTWLSEMAGRSVIKTDVTVTSSDKVLTLSTCTPGGASRFIVMGKLAAVND